MADRTGATSVLKADKREFGARGDMSLRASSVYLFWLVVSMGSLVLAAISYITTDIGDRLAEEFAGIDARTTASVVPITRGITVAQRVEQAVAVDQQQQRRQLDDLTRVLYRLRGEQASLTNRVSEIDALVTQNRNRTTALEERVTEGFAQLRTDVSVVNVSKLSFPPNLDPEATPVSDPRGEALKNAAIVPHTVKTERLSTETEASALSNPESGTGDNATAVGKSASSSYAKSVRTVATRSDAPVDPTVVGSIGLAASTQFAIDLGVNPTVERAQDLWASIGKSHPGIHQSASPRYLPTGNQEGETRLVVGPYVDANEAIKACVALRLAKSFCKTTLFPN